MSRVARSVTAMPSTGPVPRQVGQTAPTRTSSGVVALVSSRGGLDALSRVLAPLPATFPAALIALQHQVPEHESALAEILNRRTALAVRPAQDGEFLDPGVVHVAPAGQHTLVLPSRQILLIASGVAPPNRPSADLLLTSLAISLREAVVAVVLSGGGHDGATGATAVHALGGRVIAADEASSERFSMPEATIGRDGITDRVIGVDDIAALLQEMLTPAP